MAAAKGKRPAQGSKGGAARKAPAKKTGSGNKRKSASRANDQILSSAMIGVLLFGVGLLLFITLFSKSNAAAIMFIRTEMNGWFGKMRHFYVLLLCLFGLQVAFGDRWPYRKSAIVLVLLILLCISTLLQVFRMDHIARQLSSGGHGLSFNNFLWQSYESSRILPLAGGFLGAVLGYPLGRYLDVLGSALLLFFCMGALVMFFVKMVVPGAGDSMSSWMSNLVDDFGEWRQERTATQQEKRAQMAVRQQDASLLVPVPEELLVQDEQEEAPPVPPAQTRKPAVRGRAVTQKQAVQKQAAPPMQEEQRSKAQKPRLYVDDIVFGEQADPPLPTKAPIPSMQMPQMPKMPQMPQMPQIPQMSQGGTKARSRLYIEDVLPEGSFMPTEGEFQMEEEPASHRDRPPRKDPNAIPDFIAKRRAQYDEAYGAFGETMATERERDTEPAGYDTYSDSEYAEPYAQQNAYGSDDVRDAYADDIEYDAVEPVYVDPGVYDDVAKAAEDVGSMDDFLSSELDTESQEDAPWEPIDAQYQPDAVQDAPVRRRRARTSLATGENPADYHPQLDPKTRLDRPDWKPEEPTAAPVMEIEEIEEYRQPPFSLLVRDEGKNTVDTRAQDAESAQKLEQTLRSFGVEARVIKVVHGPAVTRYELQPAPGVKVSKIVNLTDDIALNMAAIGVRIEAPIPGKAAIGIEIANDDVATVNLRDVLESDESIRHTSKLAVALGKDIAGKRIIADLSRMPHLLIAGATGSGKSVCINTLITSIIYRATPEEVRLILIDPKKVELSMYNGIPHLLVPVVTDPKKASGALSWAVMEMDERYKLFAEVGVRDIRGYNSRRDPETPLMPQIVVIIDELSDLMLVAPGEVEDYICRIAQLARACGIHLVIATQRPSVNVITGIIKANIPSRIAFAVSSQVDSRTILDTAGAEKLLGKGDMLYAPSGGGKPMRVQGCFVSDREVQLVTDYVKDRHTTDYSQAVIEALSAADAEAAAEEEAPDSVEDALYEQAVEMAVESGQASISMLQRRLRIGYARAGRLVDDMSRKGIISQADGAKPREVLISREEMQRMFGRD